MFLSSATVRSAAVALVCALGLHLAFPLTTWWWLAPFALAGLIFSWCSLTPGTAALVGYISGVLFFALGFSWFGETAGRLLGPAAPILDIGPAMIEAIAFAFAAAIASLAARYCDVRAVPFVAAAAYTLGEQLRSTGVMGVPLEQLGITMIDSPLRALAAYAGGYGITFAAAALGASLGWWLLDRGDARRARVAIVTWLAIAACSALAFAFWPARHVPAPARRVAAVQGGIAQTLKMSPAGVATAIDRYVSLTQSLRGSHVTLVLWPETVINAPYADHEPGGDALSRRFAALARELDAPLYVGTIRNIAGVGASNALVIYDPHAPAFAHGNGITASYGKEKLVPFAEYLPGPQWLRALPFANQVGSYVPMRNGVETIGGATPLICWESNFGDIAFARLEDDPTLFLVATDDAWFGTTQGPYEQAQATALRAVETGRWVLRAGATGISGIIAPDGSWTHRTTLGGAALVVGDVGAPAPGPYAHIGPTAIGIVLALVTCIPFLLPLLRRNARVNWRIAATVAAFAFLAWVGYEIGRAGGDIPLQRGQTDSTLLHGTVSGKRLDGRAWSLDYDTVSLSPDGTQATIAHVKDGRLHRAGKPDVHMKADGVTVNTVTNDLTVTGPVSFSEQLAPGRVRTFATNGARYAGATRTLTIDHPAKITDAGATVSVTRMTVNFRTGDTTLGRIEGQRPGNAP